MPYEDINMNSDYLGSVGGTGTITISTNVNGALGATGPMGPTGVGTGIYTPSTTGIGIAVGPGQTYTINANDTFNWSVNIEDPIQKQIDVLTEFMNEYKAERELRKKYPALGHAYEQYEVMLEMCKSKEADDAAGENSKNP